MTLDSERPRAFFSTDEGWLKFFALAEDDALWLTRTQLADLLHSSKQNIDRQVRRVLREGALDPAKVSKKVLGASVSGRLTPMQVCGLELVLAVGYRVRTGRAIQLRRWATAQLSEYLIKGFVMNDARLADAEGHGCPRLAACVDLRQVERLLTTWKKTHAS